MRKPVVNEFIRLVEIDSPSRRERPLADYLLERSAQLGLTLSEDNAGSQIGGNAGNLTGIFPGDNREPLLICAHMDTVSSNKGITVVNEDGVLHSEGHLHILGADDKAGIAAILEMLRRLEEDNLPHPPIEVFFSIAEEVGLWGSKLVDVTKFQSRQGLVLDAGGPIGNVIRRSPVHHEFKIKVYGRSAHAGNSPELGINAIQMASKIVATIKLGRIDEYTTANIGKISGGEADNIVPDYAELSGEVRSHEPEKLLRYLTQLGETVERVAKEYGGKAELESAESFPAMHLVEDSRVAKATQVAAAKLDLPWNLVVKGGGSDANILNGKGITCANLGIGGYNAHSPEEYISVTDLEMLVNYLITICEVW